MKDNKLHLRAMIYEEGGVFIAACIDIALAAQDSSAKEVRNKLDAQIKDYVSEALSEKQYTLDLIKNRKAPFSWFVRYYYIKFTSFFRSKNKIFFLDSGKFCH